MFGLDVNYNSIQKICRFVLFIAETKAHNFILLLPIIVTATLTRFSEISSATKSYNVFYFVYVVPRTFVSVGFVRKL